MVEITNTAREILESWEEDTDLEKIDQGEIEVKTKCIYLIFLG